MAEQTKYLTDAELESLRGGTDGPWEWVFGGLSPRLTTPDRGKLIVMDFVRRGMQGAEPRFARWDGLGAGEPRGRRGGILTPGYDHPDARLIAASPALLSEVIERRARDAAVAELVEAANALYTGSHTWPGTAKLERVRLAVAAVRGGAQ